MARLHPYRLLANQQSFNADILIEIRPMHAVTCAADLNIGALIRCAMRQPRIPINGHGDGTTIFEVDRPWMGVCLVCASGTRLYMCGTSPSLICSKSRPGAKMRDRLCLICDGIFSKISSNAAVGRFSERIVFVRYC